MNTEIEQLQSDLASRDQQIAALVNEVKKCIESIETELFHRGGAYCADEDGLKVRIKAAQKAIDDTRSIAEQFVPRSQFDAQVAHSCEVERKLYGTQQEVLDLLTRAESQSDKPSDGEMLEAVVRNGWSFRTLTYSDGKLYQLLDHKGRILTESADFRELIRAAMERKDV